MNKKRNMIATIMITLLIIIALWVSGLIPKQIARISATHYLKENFPKLQLEYVEVEWSSSFGGYSIRFKDENNEIYAFIMNNKYFPINPGQGIVAIEEKYSEQNKINFEEPIKADNISIEIKSGTLIKQGATIIITNKNTSPIVYGEWFRIDKKQDEEWIETKIINKDYIFDALAYRINGNSKAEDKINWSNLYGTLNSGQYRLVKEISEKYIAVEFSID